MKNMKKIWGIFTIAVILITSSCAFLPAPVKTVEKTFQLFEVSMTWEEAKAYCESLGGFLATITTEEEQRYIETVIAGGSMNYYWIGGFCENDRQFKWITGEPMNFSAWVWGEPNNYQGNQDKIVIYRVNNPVTGGGQYRWDDLNNQGIIGNEPFFSIGNFGFICEWNN